MRANLTNVFDGADAQDRLSQLGLSLEPLLDAARRGMAAAAGCTPNHPPVLSGILAWGETISALREYLLPLRWSRRDEGNLPLTVNESETMAITVATGDEDTGRADGTPCTKSKKGPRVASAVSINQLQLFPIPIERGAEEPIVATWLLLIHRDHTARELRVELSRPIRMSEDGRVDAWAERILLGAVPFDHDIDIIPVPTPPAGPDVVVEIKRRA